MIELVVFRAIDVHEAYQFSTRLHDVQFGIILYARTTCYTNGYKNMTACELFKFIYLVENEWLSIKDVNTMKNIGAGAKNHYASIEWPLSVKRSRCQILKFSKCPSFEFTIMHVVLSISSKFEICIHIVCRCLNNNNINDTISIYNNGNLIFRLWLFDYVRLF